MYNVALREMPPSDRLSTESEFKPNLVNSVCYLVEAAVQVGQGREGRGGRGGRGGGSAGAAEGGRASRVWIKAVHGRQGLRGSMGRRGAGEQGDKLPTCIKGQTWGRGRDQRDGAGSSSCVRVAEGSRRDRGTGKRSQSGTTPLS